MLAGLLAALLLARLNVQPTGPFTRMGRVVCRDATMRQVIVKSTRQVIASNHTVLLALDAAGSVVEFRPPVTTGTTTPAPHAPAPATAPAPAPAVDATEAEMGRLVQMLERLLGREIDPNSPLSRASPILANMQAAEKAARDADQSAKAAVHAAGLLRGQRAAPFLSPSSRGAAYSPSSTLTDNDVSRIAVVTWRNHKGLERFNENYPLNLDEDVMRQR